MYSTLSKLYSGDQKTQVLMKVLSCHASSWSADVSNPAMKMYVHLCTPSLRTPKLTILNKSQKLCIACFRLRLLSRSATLQLKYRQPAAQPIAAPAIAMWLAYQEEGSTELHVAPGSCCGHCGDQPEDTRVVPRSFLMMPVTRHQQKYEHHGIHRQDWRNYH